MLAYNDLGTSYEYLQEQRMGMFLVLEYAREGDMCQLLMKINEASDKIVLYFFKQLIEAMEYLHSIGLCHKNLSLMNMLVDENYKLKITDFSYASPLSNQDGPISYKE